MGQENSGRDFIVLHENSTSKKYPVRPEDISAGKPGSLLSTFGKCEIETSAERLVLFFQSKGMWCETSMDELSQFYKLQGWDFNKVFFGLMGLWFDDAYMVFDWVEVVDVFIALSPEGGVFVTNKFVDRCAKAADPTNFLKTVEVIKREIDKLELPPTDPDNRRN
jgi:hypothetical protein